jgi:hypothetical protein
MFKDTSIFCVLYIEFDKEVKCDLLPQFMLCFRMSCYVNSMLVTGTKACRACQGVRLCGMQRKDQAQHPANIHNGGHCKLEESKRRMLHSFVKINSQTKKYDAYSLLLIPEYIVFFSSSSLSPSSRLIMMISYIAHLNSREMSVCNV